MTEIEQKISRKMQNMGYANWDERDETITVGAAIVRILAFNKFYFSIDNNTNTILSDTDAEVPDPTALRFELTKLLTGLEFTHHGTIDIYPVSGTNPTFVKFRICTPII